MNPRRNNKRIKCLLIMLGVLLLSIVYKVCAFDYNYEPLQLFFTMIIAMGNTFTLMVIIYILNDVIQWNKD